MTWKNVVLGEIFEFIRNGLSIKQDKSGEGLPITRIETISNSTVDSERVGFANLSGQDYDRWLLKPGDILFSHINSIEHLGKCAIYEGIPEKLIHGMNLLNLRCDQKIADAKYIRHYLRSKNFRPKLEKFINPAVNQASVSITNLKSIPILLPPLEEQKRIAEILDKADVLRQKRSLAIRKLDTLIQSVFLEMFGDPIINPKRWSSEKLRHVCHTTSGGTPKRDQKDYYNGSIPWIKSGELKDGVIRTAGETITEKGLQNSSAKIFPKGTLLIAMYGATVGKLGILQIDAATNQAICGITLSNKIDQTYLFYFLLNRRRSLVARSFGGAQPNISQEIIRNLTLPLPPMSLQRRFADFVGHQSEIKTKCTYHKRRAEEFFYSLRERAFTGNLFSTSIIS